MTRRRQAATGAALSVGFVATLGGVFAVEARLAKKWVGTPTQRPPVTSGWYGHHAAEPLFLSVMGDSSVAGVGVDFAHETMPAMLAAGLASVSQRPVRLFNHGVSGARTRDLGPQLARTVVERPDVCAVVVGANDVTHFSSPWRSARELAAVVRTLRDAEIPVVVGTCPDLGTVRPVPPPLRQLAWLWSREMARRQTLVAVTEGARTVSLAQLLGPSFAIDPLMWAPDRFHPSGEGYASAASALLPAVAVAAGVIPDIPPKAAGRTPRLISLRSAARAAARRGGTEVSATPGGRGLVRLRRRRTAPPATVPGELPLPHA